MDDKPNDDPVCIHCGEPSAEATCRACAADIDRELREQDAELCRSLADHVLTKWSDMDRVERRTAAGSLARAIDAAIDEWFRERDIARRGAA